MQIAGKTALVTGAAAGIGRATALRLAARGAARVVLVDLDGAGLAETARDVGDSGAEPRTCQVDLSDIAALHAWLGEMQAAGGYDILHNNAGVVSGARQFPQAGVETVRHVLDVNLTAVIVATEMAAEQMRARGGGVIVNTVSTVALGRGFSDALYATTKAGVMMFTRCCASLKESMNVRVAGVLPGLTNTPILKKTSGTGDYAPWMAPILAGNAMCAPEDIAEAVIDLIEDDSLAGGDWVAVRRIDGQVVRQWGHDEPLL